MNQKVKNSKRLTFIPKHIDPRDPVKREITAEIINMSLMMQDSGTTPYRYIRRAMKCLAGGEYDKACNWLQYADSFSGVFWEKDSADDEAFRVNIGILRPMFLFLTERFEELRPEKDQEE